MNRIESEKQKIPFAGNWLQSLNRTSGSGWMGTGRFGAASPPPRFQPSHEPWRWPGRSPGWQRGLRPPAQPLGHGLAGAPARAARGQGGAAGGDALQLHYLDARREELLF